MAADRNRYRAVRIMGVGSKTGVASVDQSWKNCAPSHGAGLLAMNPSERQLWPPPATLQYILMAPPPARVGQAVDSVGVSICQLPTTLPPAIHLFIRMIGWNRRQKGRSKGSH
jgi:hypothetical protein